MCYSYVVYKLKSTMSTTESSRPTYVLLGGGTTGEAAAGLLDAQPDALVYAGVVTTDSGGWSGLLRTMDLDPSGINDRPAVGDLRRSSVYLGDHLVRWFHVRNALRGPTGRRSVLACAWFERCGLRTWNGRDVGTRHKRSRGNVGRHVGDATRSERRRVCRPGV